MKRLLIILGFIFSAVSISETVTPLNYYISVSGLVGNTGTSPGSPWPESKVSTITTADSILYNRGETFTGTATYTHSGTSGHPIVFDAYGTGNNPILDGANGSTSALYFNGCSYLTINNLVVQHCNTSCQAPFNLNNCHDIIIHNCYAGQGKRGMVLTYCTGNINVNHCWFSKFTDAVSGSSPAAGGGSGIQWQHCSGSGNKLLYGKFYTDGSVLTNGVGDVISLYVCLFGNSDTFSGVPGGFGIEVAYNEIRGGSSSPSGYAAIVGGDVGGSNQYIHGNKACNTGKVGMQVQGGTNINMSDNFIYGGVFTYTSVGLSFGNYSSAVCDSITMGGNKINFYSGPPNNGVYNKFIDQANPNANSTATGLVGGPTLPLPTGWSSNTGDHVADVGAYNGLLPDPLFNDGDWNTGGTTTTAPTLVKIKVHNL